ncbi:MAG: thiamine-phosphate kinase [Acidobacteriota bacterium]|nr:thiamine-phosphate kinase [Acidobacteriota bacterium]
MDRFFRTEDEFVGWLKRRSGRGSPGMRLGIGDDAGLIRPQPGYDLILTADMSLEGVHFSPALHSPEVVGHRALARSLSDIAAMGGRPKFALISIGISKRADRPWVEGFFRGIFRLARRFGVTILGGDTAVSPGGTTVDVVLVGEVQQGRALLRSGARHGDAVFVAGIPGLSALGLLSLRRGAAKRDSKALRAHLQPEPQCRLGQFLSENRLASSAMDLSDGLAMDLSRLAKASGIGAVLWASKIPLIREKELRGIGRLSPLSLALEGGEDYKLLFTVPKRKLRAIPGTFNGARLYRIGEIRESPRGKVMLLEDGKLKPLAAKGYDHFARR